MLSKQDDNYKNIAAILQLLIAGPQIDLINEATATSAGRRELLRILSDGAATGWLRGYIGEALLAHEIASIGPGTH